MRMLTRYALTRGRFELLVSRCSQYRKGEDRQAHRPVAVAMQQTISRVYGSLPLATFWWGCAVPRGFLILCCFFSIDAEPGNRGLVVHPLGLGKSGKRFGLDVLEQTCVGTWITCLCTLKSR